jgi:hypothetical protein
MEDDVGRHISDKALEEYSLDKLSESSVVAVEDHLRACDRCRVRLDAIQPLNFVHFTEDGPIYSRATRLTTGKVMARHWGEKLDGIRECRSVSAAKRYLTQSFSQMFPEHRCEGKCGPWRKSRQRGPLLAS